MSKIKIGSIGLGGISTGVHIPGILKSDDFELVAVCDIDEARLNKRGDELNIPKSRRFVDYKDLINCPDVEAVDISTPNNVHFEIAAAACAAGKPYVLEKPITMDAFQGDKLAELTEKAGVKNMICFSYRYQSAARRARELIAEGTIGHVYHVNMQYYQGWGLPMSSSPLVWRFVKDIAASGALGDLGCHALDLVRFVTGLDYTKVLGHAGTFVKSRKKTDGSGMGEVDVDDFSNMLAEMGPDTGMSFEISRFAYGRGNYQRMEIYGSKGTLVYSLDRKPGVCELEMCTPETNGFIQCEIPERCRVSQMQSFADIINGKADGLSATILDGKKNQRLLDALLYSIKNNVWVEL